MAHFCFSQHHLALCSISLWLTYSCLLGPSLIFPFSVFFFVVCLFFTCYFLHLPVCPSVCLCLCYFLHLFPWVLWLADSRNILREGRGGDGRSHARLPAVATRVDTQPGGWPCQSQHLTASSTLITDSRAQMPFRTALAAKTLHSMHPEKYLSYLHNFSISISKYHLYTLTLLQST